MKNSKRKEKINFIVGERYQFAKGFFEIKKVDRANNKLWIMWEGEDDVVERELSDVESSLLSKLWKKVNIGNIYKNEITDAVYHVSDQGVTSTSNEKYYRTVGFLAKNSKIIARVTPKTENNFVNFYVSIKNIQPYDLSGYEVDTCVNTWGNVIRIIFDTKNISSLSSFSFKNKPVSGSNDHEMIVNDLYWGMELLEMGFNIGNEHDVDEIRNKIPEQHIKNFEEGLLYE